MADIKLPVLGTGDALSQMLQVAAREAGLKDYRWCGNGVTDLKQLLVTVAGVKQANTELMHSIAEIVNLPEFVQLQRSNESISAQVALLVLRARAMIDLSQQNMNGPTAVAGGRL